MDNILYDKHYSCLACNSEFETKKVRSGKTRTTHIDSDLCSYFDGIVPYYYEINICPQCGFAFTDSFAPLKTNQKQMIYEDYAKRYLPQGVPNLCDERDEHEAILSFKLALGAGFAMKEQPKLLAGICMRLAWLHRMAERTEEEHDFIAAANRFFQVAYETQLDSLDDAYYLHMLGDTSLRLDRISEARRWFSQLFAPANSGYRYIELARDAWAEHRYEQETTN